jgi:transketolase C-terminal domain/subunit
MPGSRRRFVFREQQIVVRVTEGLNTIGTANRLCGLAKFQHADRRVGETDQGSGISRSNKNVRIICQVAGLRQQVLWNKCRVLVGDRLH